MPGRAVGQSRLVARSHESSPVVLPFLHVCLDHLAAPDSDVIKVCVVRRQIWAAAASECHLAVTSV